MSGNHTNRGVSLRPPQLSGLAGRLAATQSEAQEARGETEDQDSCPAFGYLRGVRDRALALEFRFRSGDSEWFSYSLLAAWRYNPSVGLLLKFTGDLVSLVLIRGSNLAAPVRPDGGMNLTTYGLQRHRVLWVREMDADALRRAGQTGPTIDRIDIAEFESHTDMMEWLGQAAPAFVR